MLSAPWVIGPITPCSRYVRVEGLLPRATVRLFRAGGVQIGEAAAQLPFDMIPLDAAVQLEPGWEIAATQEKDGEVSEPSPVPYQVLLPPSLDALELMFFLAPPVQCGTCVSLGGIVPGATVMVELSGNPPATTVAKWATATLTIPGGISVGPGVPAPITVRQRGCGHDRGAVVTFPPPLKLQSDLPPSVESSGVPSLPAPVLEPPPQACQRLLHLTGIQPGAVVHLKRGDGTILTECFGSTEGELGLPDAGLKPDELVTLWQQYDTRECHRRGVMRKVRADPGRPEAPSFAAPPCAGDVFATVAGLVPGALVHFFRDDETQPFLVGAATRRVSMINLPTGWSATRLSVRQAVCPNGPWTEAAIARVRPSAPPLEPRLIEPLVACAAAVAVTTTVPGAPGQQIGFIAGTHIRVFSDRWHGVIGEAAALGDRYTTVNLWLPLMPGDRVWADARRGSLSQAVSPVATEQAPPGILPLPLIDTDQDGQVDDCTGSISVSAEPGVIVDVEQVPGPAFPADTAGILLASVCLGRESTPLPVPPLEPDKFVRARARRCGKRSEPGQVAKAIDRGPVYELGTTFRLCQLTGAPDPVNRPLHQDTREFSLRGTDLGIPVDHRGTLWFFFGDADPFEFGPFKFYGDDDPFAWTEDEPEPDGPRLHFVTDNTNIFVSALEEAIGALTGGILGTVVAALVTQIGVAGALLGGVTGAALGALVGWFIDIVPAKRFRQLAVDGLPDLENFEVPVGGFSFDDRLFLFIAREKVPTDGVMRASHLAVSKNSDPSNNFKHLFNVSLMIGDLPATDVPAHLKKSDFPAGEWLVHIAPVRVRNAEWQGLPSDKGEGLLLFGTDRYLSANVRLAWAPLTPGQPPPPPAMWLFYMGENKPWLTAAAASASGVAPQPLLLDAPKVAMLGELSVSWSSALRRWIMTSEAGRIRFARRPQGPWTVGASIFDGDDTWRAADNIAPDGSRRWVRVPHEDPKYPGHLTVSYAPYHLSSWTRVDHSVRSLTIYYTLSVEHPPYNSQLVRSILRGN
jgi:hypothetical protein